MDHFVARLSADQGSISLGSVVEFDLSSGSGDCASLSTGVITIDKAGTYFVSINLGGVINEGTSVWELRNSSSTPINDDAGQVLRLTLHDNDGTNATESPAISSVITFAVNDTLQVEVVIMDNIVSHDAETSTLTLVRLS